MFKFLSLSTRLSNIEDYTQTPSSSDTGVSDLESMLKEKDTELSHLRVTMEQNEQVRDMGC